MEQNDVIRLKLLIDTKGQRVLFAEADKTIVDFLFHLLAYPLGSVCELLKSQNMVGCLGNLYQSVETWNQYYLQPNNNIHNNNCCSYVSNDPKAFCSNCKNHMSREITYVKPISYYEDEGGYVKDLVTYIVMDDLTIIPMSNIPTITLLKKFNIRDMGALEEKLITFNVNEGVKLLEASLKSKTALTDVFLGKSLSPPKTVSKGKKPTPKVNTKGKKSKIWK